MTNIVGHYGIAECREVEEATDAGVEAEEHEVFVVVVANTIRHPGTVMIHHDSATFADLAVMSSRRLPIVAVHAIGIKIGLWTL